ncbi:MAG: AAA family ATPase [Nitrososphaerales archaeon]
MLKLNKVEIIGFRGFIKESFTLDDLSVFYGSMGSGKTSRLLAILYGLTGLTVSGLNLDDLIHTDSEFMWVKIIGNYNNQPFFIERMKRRGKPSQLKTDLKAPLDINEKIFIEGREIAKLFIGAPMEKLVKLDQILGLSDYDQIISAITTAPIDKKQIELSQYKSLIQQTQASIERLSKIEEELKSVENRLKEINYRMERDSSLYNWAESIKKRMDEQIKRSIEIEGKKRMLESYKAQLSSIPPPSEELKNEVSELEAKYNAMQKRIAFLEAAMQTLDLEGKKIEEIVTCPLCGSLIKPNILERFKNYDEEYRSLISRISDLEALLNEKRKRLEVEKKNFERMNILKEQIKLLEEEISRALPQVEVLPGDLEVANRILDEKARLTQEKLELEIKSKSLVKQIDDYKSLITQVPKLTLDEINSRLNSLTQFRDRLMRIKLALIDVVNDVRSEQLNNLKSSFKEAFKKIYPYQRFDDIDFDTEIVRGRQVLIVKGRVGNQWLYSHQMSTGENVALSFALLFAANRLEKAPLLLLDEPEEGLDEKGIEGLRDVLINLKLCTQIVVATRSKQLAELLSSKVISI